MQEILIEDLIDKARGFIEKWMFGPDTKSRYNSAWRRFLDFCIKQDIELFDIKTAFQFLETSNQNFNTGMISKKAHKYNNLCIKYLIQLYETGIMKWERHMPIKQTGIIRPEHKGLLDDFRSELLLYGLSASTINRYQYFSHTFIVYIENNRYNESLKSLCLQDITNFLTYYGSLGKPGNMEGCLTALRRFLSFLNESGYTKLNLRYAIPSRMRRRKTIIPIITPDEEIKLSVCSDCRCAIEKRDYAIFMIAMKLGIRTSDILHLRFEDIDWYKNIIHIIQKKTGKELYLPLLVDVGNAIADYILNARPKSDIPFIFLRAKAPYASLTGHGHHVSCRLFKKAKIRQSSSDRKGLHLFRHTLASRLLYARIPLPVISSVLGHADKNSAKPYLSIDIQGLKKCALDLTGIEIQAEVLL